MATKENNILSSLRTEMERGLLTIRQPDYYSQVRKVFPYLVNPEAGHELPIICYEITDALVQRDQRAMGRVRRRILFRLSCVVREEIHRPVEVAVDAIARDIERMFYVELSTMQNNIKLATDADLLLIYPPDWARIATTQYRPFGIAVGSVSTIVAYDYGQP